VKLKISRVANKTKMEFVDGIPSVGSKTSSTLGGASENPQCVLKAFRHARECGHPERLSEAYGL
jgi:hypothetical protein